MARWKIGSLTAAVGCIVLGVMIALISYGYLTYDAIGYLWPCLLIALGLEMLARLFFRSERKAGVSGLAVLLILVLAGASAAQSVYAGGSLDQLLGKSRLVPVAGELQTEGASKVVIALPDGRVKLDGVDGEVLTYEGELKVSGEDDAAALQRLQGEWRAEVSGNEIILKLDRKSIGWLDGISFGTSGTRPYLNVKVPRGLAVELRTSNGSVEAAGLVGSTDIRTSNGRLDFRAIGGELKAHSSNGSITASGVTGKAELSSSNGSMELAEMGGELSASSSNGAIRVESAVGGDWRLETSNGKIEIDLLFPSDVSITATTSSGSLKGDVDWEKNGDHKGTARVGDDVYDLGLTTSNGSITVNVKH